MDSLPYLLGGGLLAAAVVLYVLLPLVRGLEAPLHRSSEEHSEDEFRKQVALSALRDVEYDYATGKLDEKDYRELKGELSVEALRILETLRDRESATAGSVGHAEEEGAGADPAEEGGEGISGEEVDALEAEIARIREGLQEGRACRECGHLNPRGSQFCGRCGTELDVSRSAAERGR